MVRAHCVLGGGKECFQIIPFYRKKLYRDSSQDSYMFSYNPKPKESLSTSKIGPSEPEFC